MVRVELRSLIERLDDTCRQALESAAGLCVSRSHFHIEIDHWLVKLLEVDDTDLAALLRFYEVDRAQMEDDLQVALERKRTGNSSSPLIAAELQELISSAWLVASVDFGERAVRSCHVLVALLDGEMSSRLLRAATDTLSRITADAVRQDLPDVCADTREAAQHVSDAASARDDVPQMTGSGQALDLYTIDLTEAARAGQIDPVLGRDAEIRQIIDVLMRRRQNNPILTGEAGVGKTAVVEGFALKIAAGNVPPSMQNVTVRTLDLGLLKAGAGVQGEFENRLRSVIAEVKASPTPIIMFIDEAHTLIGAGGQAGQGDAANLLKPALARGELRTIAATTWAEYKQYFETDAALVRRFQVIRVEEPDEASAVAMMAGIAATLEMHHGVQILDEGVVEAVRLSARYLPERQLPDKCISVLDTACARVALSHSAAPAVLEDCQHRRSSIKTTVGILEREANQGSDHVARLDDLAEETSALTDQIESLEGRWAEEKGLVDRIHAARRRLGHGHVNDDAEAAGAVEGADDLPTEEGPLTDEESDELKAELRDLVAQLDELQGEDPLVRDCVDGQAVAEIVSAWTGVPLGRVVSDEVATVLSLRERMEEKVIGQSHALEEIARRVRMSRAGLTDPRKPIGVFLMVGPSGIGKTETAVTLAELLYGGTQAMTVINMSEFKEEHKVSLLMGTPPGYVGYGKGGVLTEAVRRRPYSVILLDEIEKAHPGVQEIFYQVFDKGVLRDSEGRDVDFRNTIIIMTSNAAGEHITKLCADPDTSPGPEALTEAVYPNLLETFKPAFLGRTAIVPFYPLGDEQMAEITKLQLARVAKRVKEHYDAEFEYTPEVIETIVSRCQEVETGARNIEHILSKTLLPELANEMLGRMGENVQAVRVTLDERGHFSYECSRN